MFWQVLYNRPRGIPGNYKVVIALSLREEMTHIERFGSSTDPVENIMVVGHNQNPYNLTVIFAVRRVIPGDSFGITIEDPDVAYPQKNYYEATPTGISGGLEEGSIELYPIRLIDLDVVVKNSPQWWKELFTGQFEEDTWTVISAIHKALHIT